MREERMKVLDLIEKKIITPKEAVDLINALKDGENTKDKIDKAVKKTGEIAATAKDKIYGFAKEKEPVVKETVCNIASAAGDFAEEVGRAIKSYIKKDDDDIFDDEDVDIVLDDTQEVLDTEDYADIPEELDDEDNSPSE